MCTHLSTFKLSRSLQLHGNRHPESPFCHEPYTVQSRPGAAIGNLGVTLLVTDRVSAVSTRTMSGLDRSIDSLVIGRRYAGLTVILSRPATTTSSRSSSRSKQPHRDSCVGPDTMLMALSCSIPIRVITQGCSPMDSVKIDHRQINSLSALTPP